VKCLQAIVTLVIVFPSAGCVTEEVPERAPAAARLFDLPAGVLPAGSYHDVTFYFAIDLHSVPGDPSRVESNDFPEVAEWTNEERDRESAFQRQLPPISPEILPDGHEIYRLRNVYRVDFYNSMFEVGGFRYLRMPRARLYVFKKREGNFSFSFRGQPVVVPSEKPWIPSIYYYPEDQRMEGNRRLVRDVLQVGLATVETMPDQGYWLVNGKRFYPDGKRPLELYEALHFTGTR